MENLNIQIAQTQMQLTNALKRGEPADSPHLLQMDARPERMRQLWATHRRIRLEAETREGHHANRVH
jgi:hypothetical protein